MYKRKGTISKRNTVLVKPYIFLFRWQGTVRKIRKKLKLNVFRELLLSGFHSWVGRSRSR